MTPEQQSAFADDLKRFIANLLEERLESRDFGTDDSLFLSGRLDSLAAIQLIVFLEGKLGSGFDSSRLTLAKLDTFASIWKIAAGAEA